MGVVGPGTVEMAAAAGVVAVVAVVVAGPAEALTGPVVLVAVPGPAGVAWLEPECSG